MAEIEYFVDPQHKEHKKFHTLKDLKIPLWTAKYKLSNLPIETEMTFGEAVEKKNNR